MPRAEEKAPPHPTGVPGARVFELAGELPERGYQRAPTIPTRTITTRIGGGVDQPSASPWHHDGVRVAGGLLWHDLVTPNCAVAQLVTAAARLQA